MKQIGDKINEYMRNVHRFADIFNYYLYDGKPSVKADQLHELSPDKTTPPLVQNVLGETAHNAFSHFIAMRDDHMVYLLLNVWDQSGSNYAIAVKDLLFAASQYTCQLEEMDADGKLLPVINVVLYWSPEKWDSAESIHELLKTDNRQLLQFIPNYRINLLAPFDMDDGDFGKFQTSLAECLQFVKYSHDTADLRCIIEKNPKFQHLNKSAAELINAIMWENLMSDYDIREIDMRMVLNYLFKSN